MFNLPITQSKLSRSCCKCTIYLTQCKKCHLFCLHRGVSPLSWAVFVRVNGLHCYNQHWIHTRVQFPVVAGSCLCREDGEREQAWVCSHLMAGLTEHQLWITSIDHASMRSPSAPWQQYQAQRGPARPLLAWPSPGLHCTAKAGPSIAQALHRAPWHSWFGLLSTYVPLPVQPRTEPLCLL